MFERLKSRYVQGRGYCEPMRNGERRNDPLLADLIITSPSLNAGNLHTQVDRMSITNEQSKNLDEASGNQQETVRPRSENPFYLIAIIIQHTRSSGTRLVNAASLWNERSEARFRLDSRTDEELSDMGISRSDIPRLVRNGRPRQCAPFS